MLFHNTKICKRFHLFIIGKYKDKDKQIKCINCSRNLANYKKKYYVLLIYIVIWKNKNIFFRL